MKTQKTAVQMLIAPDSLRWQGVMLLLCSDGSIYSSDDPEKGWDPLYPPLPEEHAKTITEIFEDEPLMPDPPPLGLVAALRVIERETVDFFYKIREDEGKGWQGPRMIAWEAATQRVRSFLSGAPIAGTGIDQLVTGVAMIANERERQVHVKGYDADHDAEHADGELLRVAGELVSYVDPHMVMDVEDDWNIIGKTEHRFGDDKEGAEIRLLTIAGALIAAEIDRRTCAKR